jgi:hypothetical protein
MWKILAAAGAAALMLTAAVAQDAVPSKEQLAADNKLFITLATKALPHRGASIFRGHPGPGVVLIRDL